MMDTSSMGLSCASVLTSPIRCTILIPEVTRPKMVCFPSSQGVGARVMKLFGQEMSVWRAGGGRGVRRNDIQLGAVCIRPRVRH